MIRSRYMRNEDIMNTIAEYLINPRKLFGLTSNSSIRTESQDSSYKLFIISRAIFAPSDPASLGPHFLTILSVRFNVSFTRSSVTYLDIEITKTPY